MASTMQPPTARMGAQMCIGMKKRLWLLRLRTISLPVALSMTVCEVRLRSAEPRNQQTMADGKRLTAKGHLCAS